MDKTALGQVFIRVFPFSPSLSFYQCFVVLIYCNHRRYVGLI